MKWIGSVLLCSAVFVSGYSSALAETSAVVAPAEAKTEIVTHTVKSRGVRFDPMFIYIKPGDRVSWENMASHNIETIDTMVPEGQPKIMTELGDNAFFTFDKVGLVTYKCTPHWGARMGGIIVVGKPENVGKIIDDYMASTEVHKSTLPARGLLKKLRKDMEEKGLL